MADLTLQLVEKQVHLHTGENTGEARAAAQAAKSARDDILNDPGFQTVSSDLTGANTIGAVAARDADIAAAVANMTAIQAAPAAAVNAANSAAAADASVSSFKNARAAVAYDGGTVSTLSGGTNVPNTNNGSATLGWPAIDAVAAYGVVEQVSARMSAAGTGEVRIFRRVRGLLYRLVSKAPVSWAGGGPASVQTVNVDPLFVQPNDLVVLCVLTGGVPRIDSSGSGLPYFPATVPSTIGDTATAAPTTSRACFTYTMRAAATTVAQKLANLAHAETLDAGAIRGNRTLFTQLFASNPSDWTLGSTFTASNGLAATGAGDWTKLAFYNRHTSLQRALYHTEFSVTDTASVFGMMTKPPGGNTRMGGVAMIDGSANKLQFWNWNGTAGTQAKLQEVTIPALVAGRRYRMSVSAERLTIVVTLVDLTLQTTTTLSFTWTGSGTAWCFLGYPGFIHISGTWEAEYFEAHATTPRYCRALIFGDSNTQGTAPGVTSTWADLLFNDRSAQRDIVVSCRSGDKSSDGSDAALLDLVEFRPQYAVWALSTNDTSQANYRTGAQAFIDACRLIGAEPILMCLMPKGDTTPNRDRGIAINTDIRTGYFGRVRYIDVATPLSVGNDGFTWLTADHTGDLIHLTWPVGQTKQYEIVKQQAPWLLA